MRKGRLFAVLCALLASFFAAAALSAAVYCRNRTPILLYAPEEAVEQARNFMEAVCAGDFAGAQTMLYGSWDLGAAGEPSDPVAGILWDAYVDSLDYELVGELYATRNGLAQNVKLVYLELPALTENLGSRSRALLEKAVETAEDVSQIYDKNNGYREDLVMDILGQAACEAVEADRRYTYQTLSLPLVYEDGRWWVMANQELLKAISGGMAG